MKSKLKRYGLKGFLERSFWMLLHFIKINFERYYLFEKEINNTDLEKNKSFVEFKSLTFADFEIQKGLNTEWFTDVKMASLKEALTITGNTAYGLFSDDLLISYGFLSTQYLGLKDTKLLENDCYLWDAYTHPCARGQKLHYSLTIYIEREARKMGKKRALVIVASFNKASYKTYQKLGYTLIQKYYTLSLWRYKEKTNFKYGK